MLTVLEVFIKSITHFIVLCSEYFAEVYDGNNGLGRLSKQWTRLVPSGKWAMT
jgi:hypothetical protein